MTKLSILEQIIKAKEMGYSAIVQSRKARTLERIVIGVAKNSIVVRGMNSCTFSVLDKYSIEYQLKITGYTFVGNLFGEPKIKEGQKFRVKATGEIGIFKSTVQNGLLTFHNLSPNIRLFNLSELEPYFE